MFPEVKLLKDLLELNIKTIFKLGLLWNILNHNLYLHRCHPIPHYSPPPLPRKGSSELCSPLADGEELDFFLV